MPIRGVNPKASRSAADLLPTRAGPVPGQVPAAEALPLYEEMLILRQELGDTWGVAGAHNAIAALQLKRGARGAAVAHVAAALPLFESVADMLGVAECLESVGLVRYEQRGAEGEQGEAARRGAARALGAAAGVRKAIGADVKVVTAHAAAVALKRSHATEWMEGGRLEPAAAARLAEQEAAAAARHDEQEQEVAGAEGAASDDTPAPSRRTAWAFSP